MEKEKCPKQESNNFIIIIMLNYLTNGNRAKNSQIKCPTNLCSCYNNTRDSFAVWLIKCFLQHLGEVQDRILSAVN